MAGNSFSGGRSGKSTIFIVIVIIGLLLLLSVGFALFYAGAPPVITIEPAAPMIGRGTAVTVEVAESRRGLVRVRVELTQNGKTVELADKDYEPSWQIPFMGARTARDTLNVEAGLRTFPGLTGGTAVIKVTADRAGTWLRSPAPVVKELTLPVRLTPPALRVTSTHNYVKQGGSEVVTYRVGDFAVRDGVRVGDRWFPGYPLPGGGAQDRFALFAIPYDMPSPEARVVVEDAAGNHAETAFIEKFTRRPLRRDTIKVSGPFLNRVVPPVLAQTPEIKEQGTLLDTYLMINRDVRRENAATIVALAGQSQPAFLWSRPFLMMPKTKVTAAFAERRTYMYEGREVDEQDHLGFDLAEVRQAKVPAANDGVVVLARYFGIYGNAVIIDHGYGLMTIYGHLSSLEVKDGQKVTRGDIIGRTGVTGLAGGDHLHYCTLLAGLPVDPVEWSDGHWIQDRIARKLGAAFAFKN